MTSFLINKNLCLYYWLKKRIGKKRAFWMANTIEKVILIFGREQVEEKKMLAYAFYMFAEIEQVHFIGLLPERRKNPKRITQESISDFVRTFLGNEADVDNLFFIEITVDERTGEMVQPDPPIRLTQAQA